MSFQAFVGHIEFGRALVVEITERVDRDTYLLQVQDGELVRGLKIVEGERITEHTFVIPNELGGEILRALIVGLAQGGFLSHDPDGKVKMHADLTREHIKDLRQNTETLTQIIKPLLNALPRTTVVALPEGTRILAADITKPDDGFK